MENLFEILFRISISVSLFFILYWLLLRKATHFKANRLFLVISLILSVIVAFFPVQYEVLAESAPKPQFLDLKGETANISVGELPGMEETKAFNWVQAFIVIYISGIAFFFLRLLTQSLKPLRIILKTKPNKINGLLVHENNQFSLPFSFFNRIFINPKYHKQEELDDILAHEKVHIRERHWIDLIIIELLTVFLWFNPFIWLFERVIKQNHEYLADKGVLTRGHSPVRYQALLINQLMGMQVIGITNNLNFALGPTRLKMMTKQKTPKKKLARMALALPVIAVLLVAFAKPDYQSKSENAENPIDSHIISEIEKTVIIKGRVVNENGEALSGASVILKGTTLGAVSDMDGKFKLDVPISEEINLVTSFVGFKTHVSIITYKKDFEWVFKLERAVIGIDTKRMFLEGEMPPPPPPPAPKKMDGDVFYIVEKMPAYPQGYYGLGKYVKTKKGELKEKLFFEGEKLEGKAIVGFTINTKGDVTNIHVKKKTTDTAAKALYIIVKGMEKWSPGEQRGKPVPVDYAMELEF